MGGSDSGEVVIVGGGVIGCAIAYYLARQGLSVTLFERGLIGGEASGAAAGMLAPLTESHGQGPFLELALASLRLFPTLLEDLRAETGIDTQYVRSGVLRLSLSEDEALSLRARLAWLAPLGQGVHWLGPAELRLLEPRLTKRAAGALFSPNEGHLNSGRLVQALARASEARGARLWQETPVRALVRRRGRIVGVRTRDGLAAAGQVVLAAGAWTARFGLPVRPVRGQMLALAGGTPPLRQILWGPAGYLVPQPNSFLFAGATIEEVGYRRRTTRAGLARLHHMASTLVSSLRRTPLIDAWAGLRPGSPDALPILGPVPGVEGLWAATGHFRNGILLAPITGDFMARSILDGKPAPELAPFLPARFSPQQPGSAG